jgi:hypothetical protein
MAKDYVWPATVDPHAIGCDTSPGHTLTCTSQHSYAKYYYTFVCSCGMQFSGRMTQQGRMGTSFVRSWKQHIEADNDGTELTHIGTIKKKRVTWKVVIFNRNYPSAGLYDNGRYVDWVTGGRWYAAYPWAVAVDKMGKGRRILAITKTKKDAIEKALQEIENGEAQGFEVEVVIETNHLTTATPTITAQLASLLDEANDSLTGDIASLSESIQRIDEVTSLLFILDHKKSELKEAYEKRTTGLITT